MRKMGVRVWIQTLAIVCAATCAIALLIATLGGAAGAAVEHPESGQFVQPAQSAAQSTAGQSSSSQTSSNQRAASQSGAVQLQTYEGVVTDTHCGAKHSAAIAETAADCTRVCVHAGDHFALVDGEKMYVLEGERDALKRAAGERVKVIGTQNGNTISVVSVRSPQS